MLNIIANLEEKLLPLRSILEQFGQPLSDLLIRLVMAWVFLKSGWMKLNYYLNDNWDTVLYLFAEEHPVPFLPVEVAAVMGTAAETILPVLLVLGLFARIAALGLIGVTLVIVSTGIASLTLSAQMEHIMWIAMLTVILVRGAGKISLDRFVFRRSY